MSLTLGTGPFGPAPAGSFNFRREGPAHVLYWEDCPRRIRAVLAGTVVADSRRAKLLHETGLAPVYYLPAEDLAGDLLEASPTRTHCPFKGDAAYWSLRAGDRVVEDAVWGYDEPLPHAPPLAGHRALYWSKVDAWYEEDEEVFVHPRDPYHRVDAVRSRSHVEITLDGEALAASSDLVAVFETGLPTRWYLPRADVRAGVLEPGSGGTRCPYKGRAAMLSARLGERLVEDLAWTYADPLPAVAAIRDRVAFLDERVDVSLDGERLQRPGGRVR